MRGVAAVVESAFDLKQLSRDIARAHVELQDIDRKIATNEAQGKALRDQQAMHRLEMGKMLIDAKKACGHGGWLAFLEKQGIVERTAREWMALAGHIDSKSAAPKTAADLPSSRQVAKARSKKLKSTDASSPADSDEDEADDSADDDEQDIDLGRELTSIRMKASELAAAVSANARKQIAQELREEARVIEEM